MSTVLPNLGAKPTDLKIENVYKITKLNGKSESRELTRYKELNLIYADGPKNLTDNDSLFTFKIDGEPMWVKHVGEKEHNTYRVDDHRQMAFSAMQVSAPLYRIGPISRPENDYDFRSVVIGFL